VGLNEVGKQHDSLGDRPGDWTGGAQVDRFVTEDGETTGLKHHDRRVSLQ
jgi:hypothetical protein